MLGGGRCEAWGGYLIAIVKWYRFWREELRALLAARIRGRENDSCRQKMRETILGARTHRQDRFNTNAILVQLSAQAHSLVLHYTFTLTL